MRTISIQADGEQLDQIMEEWLAHLVRTILVGESGIKFDGDLSNGTIVNHRAEDRWTVSFRPNPDGSRRRVTPTRMSWRGSSSLASTRRQPTDRPETMPRWAGRARALRSWVRVSETSGLAGCRS